MKRGARRDGTKAPALSLQSRLVLGTAIATSSFLGGYRGYVRRAFADCDPVGSPGHYACSGMPTQTQTLTGTPLMVTTSPGFKIDTTGGYALDLRGTGGLTFSDVDHFGNPNFSIITGQGGIKASNNDSGNLSITTTGPVTGTDPNIGYGIKAANSGTDLTIVTKGPLSAGVTGIKAQNNGSGELKITATGAVIGTRADGIHAENSSNGTNLTIAAGGLSGRYNGILARNQGTGALSITATGTTTGTRFDGIFARNLGTDLTIVADGDVSGGFHGISAGNGLIENLNARGGGTGAVSITTNGAVTGTKYDGIFAFNRYGTDLTIHAFNVNGGERGINALNYGTGALSITATGTTTGTRFDGIFARNSGIDLRIVADGDVSGGEHGINAQNRGTGPLSITVNGAAKGGTLEGVYARNSGTALTSVANAGAIEGSTGIFANTTGPVTITNSGSITGTGTNRNAIDLTLAGGPNTVNQQAGTINGHILLSANSDVVNLTGGTVNGDIVGQGSADLNFAGNFTFASPFAVLGFDQVTVNSGAVQFGGTLEAATLAVNGGKMIMDGRSNLTGGTTLQGGTLAVGDDDHPAAVLTGGPVDVLSGGRLQGIGTIAALTSNHAGGVIAPGNSIGTLTIAGNYVGNGGTLEIEAALGGDASPADKLVVTGDTSGSTNVRVINVGGTGAQTVEGIKVVDVGGTSAGTFALLGDFVFKGQPGVVAGPYAYVLEQNGINAPADGDWYLRSQFAPNTPLYEAYPRVLQSLNEPSTLQQRIGNRSWTVEAQGPDALSDDLQVGQRLGVWGRIDGAHGNFEPQTSTTDTDYDTSVGKLETGFDMPLYDAEAGQLIGGVAFHYGRVSSNIASAVGAGSIDATGYGLGGTLTWYGDTGFYVDGQAIVTWLNSDIHSDTLSTTLASSNDGHGYMLSVEAGQRIAIAPGWSLTPQAQLTYAAVGFDDFTDRFGATVSLDHGDSTIGRLGFSADYEDEWQDATGQTSRAHGYGIANLYHDFKSGSKVGVSGIDFRNDNQELWGGLGVGGTLSWANGKYSLYGEALASTSLENFGDSHVVSGTVGLRLSW